MMKPGEVSSMMFATRHQEFATIRVLRCPPFADQSAFAPNTVTVGRSLSHPEDASGAELARGVLRNRTAYSVSQ